MISTKLINVFKTMALTENARKMFNRNIFTNQIMLREVDDRKEMLRSLPAMDEGTAGEKALEVDSIIQQ